MYQDTTKSPLPTTSLRSKYMESLQNDSDDHDDDENDNNEVTTTPTTPPPVSYAIVVDNPIYSSSSSTSTSSSSDSSTSTTEDYEMDDDDNNYNKFSSMLNDHNNAKKINELLSTSGSLSLPDQTEKTPPIDQSNITNDKSKEDDDNNNNSKSTERVSTDDGDDDDDDDDDDDNDDKEKEEEEIQQKQNKTPSSQFSVEHNTYLDNNVKRYPSKLWNRNSKRLSERLGIKLKKAAIVKVIHGFQQDFYCEDIIKNTLRQQAKAVAFKIFKNAIKQGGYFKRVNPHNGKKSFIDTLDNYRFTVVSPVVETEDQTTTTTTTTTTATKEDYKTLNLKILHPELKNKNITLVDICNGIRKSQYAKDYFLGMVIPGEESKFAPFQTTNRELKQIKKINNNYPIPPTLTNTNNNNTNTNCNQNNKETSKINNSFHEIMVKIKENTNKEEVVRFVKDLCLLNQDNNDDNNEIVQKKKKGKKNKNTNKQSEQEDDDDNDNNNRFCKKSKAKNQKTPSTPTRNNKNKRKRDEQEDDNTENKNKKNKNKSRKNKKTSSPNTTLPPAITV